jgi:DNA phosphorothioation-associated putative methyltransferase
LAVTQNYLQSLNKGHSWVIPKPLLPDLPPELRVYVGCACQLYGDIDDMHLIKIHFTSGKVSLMRYDDFNKEIPLLMERVKIKLRQLDVDFFDYGGEYTPSPLMNKDSFS